MSERREGHRVVPVPIPLYLKNGCRQRELSRRRLNIRHSTTLLRKLPPGGRSIKRCELFIRRRRSQSAFTRFRGASRERNSKVRFASLSVTLSPTIRIQPRHRLECASYKHASTPVTTISNENLHVPADFWARLPSHQLAECGELDVRTRREKTEHLVPFHTIHWTAVAELLGHSGETFTTLDSARLAV